MRIDALNKVSSLYQANSLNKTKKIESRGTYDQVEISQFGKDYQIAKQAVANASDIREEKVNQIKASMASGTYNVKLEEVAEKMMEHYFDSRL